MANELKLQVLLNAIDRATGPLKSINTSSIGAARALKDARDNLKQLNAQQKDISAWRTQRAAAEQTEQALSAARDRVRALSQQFAATGAPTKAMTRDMRSAIREAQRLKQQHQQQGEQLQGLRTKLYDAGISTRNLGQAERDLRSKITQTNQTLGQQEAKLSRLAGQQRRFAAAKQAYERSQAFSGSMAGVGAGATAAGAAMGAPVLGVVKSYIDFEDAMLGVAKQVDGARSDSGELTATYYEMGNAIKKMSESIPMASTEIAALIEGAARMGIQGKDDLLGFAKVAANAATAFELPADQIGENLARIAGLYKLPIKNVEQLGDAINYLDDNAQSKGADIIEVLQRTAGITASVGMSFKDAAALGSTFLTLGASAEVAATATNAMIRELAIATQQPKRFQEGLKALGLEAGAIQKGMAKNATQTLQQVLEAIKKLPQSEQLSVTTQLFGKEYGDDAAKLAANIGEYRRQLELANSVKGQGSMQREADIRAEALSARLQMAKNRAFNLAAELGETLRPALVNLIDGFNRVVERITNWVKANPELAFGILKVVSGIAALAAGFGTITLGMASLLGPFAMVRYALTLFGIKGSGALGLIGKGVRVLAMALGGPLIAALRTVSIAMWGLAANPVVLAIAAVVAVLAGAAYLIYKNWDAVKAYVINLWNEIKAGFSGGIGGILTVLANFSPIGIIYRAFAEVLNYLGLDLPTKFTEFGNMIVNGLVNGLLAGMGKVKETISAIGDSTIGWFKEKLDIHSPSRVFAELGGFTMEGLTQGLQAGQKGPLNAVNNLGQQLTTAGSMGLGVAAMPGLSVDTRAPISPAAATTYDSHDNYEINIHPTPGMDALAIGRAVRAELARIESEKGARKRSQLSDLE